MSKHHRSCRRCAVLGEVERVGNTINAYSSADGATWNLVGSDTFAMGETILVGLGVSSHSTTTAATCKFDNVSGAGNGV